MTPPLTPNELWERLCQKDRNCEGNIDHAMRLLRHYRERMDILKAELRVIRTCEARGVDLKGGIDRLLAAIESDQWEQDNG
jgi:hypothetical protein